MIGWRPRGGKPARLAAVVVFGSRCLVAATAVLVFAVGCREDHPGGQGALTKAGPTAPESDDQSRFDRDRQPEVIVRALGLKPGMTVADIGAGTGLLTAHLARAVSPGGRVVATDIDAAVIDYLTSRMAAGGFGHVVEAKVVSPSEPGLDAGRFDAVNLAQVDHYFDDRVAWLKQLVPVLKPGGRIAISNRHVHKSGALAAAQAAGFHLVSETGDIPGQFVAVFEVSPVVKSKAPR